MEKTVRLMIRKIEKNNGKRSESIEFMGFVVEHIQLFVSSDS